ncbi:MAG: TatD family hydrolase [Alphaproteobacteria bacterium]
MSAKPPLNPLSMIGQIASAVGGTVGDIVREVRQDLQEMTPPESSKAPKPSITPQHVGGSGGMAHVEVEAVAVPAQPAEAVAGTKQVNPWDDASKPGLMTVDACFMAAGEGDVTRYAAALGKELDKPFTLPLVAVDAGKSEAVEALKTAMAADPRLFGAVGFGPRHVQDDLDALDDTLTTLLNDNPKLLAVGPVGLDEPYAPYTIPQQVEQLVRQLELAHDFGLPVILAHARSLPHMKAVLEGLENLPKLIWANPLETEEDIALVRKLDAYVLVRPEITYEEHRVARENLRRILPERWLLGSGSSLVAPHARSGHPNGPEGLAHTLKTFAALLDKPVAEVRTMLNANARAVFVGV